MEIPVIELPVSAANKQTDFLSSAIGFAAEHIDLNKLIQHPDATFLVQHKGLSMINAFIPPDALLLVDQSITPQNNSIVFANVNGTLMIRYLKKNDYKRKLVPANRHYPEIEIVPGMNFQVLGVVTQVISDPGKLKNVC